MQGLDLFSDADGTKHVKPDLEAACRLPSGRVLLLGSGSTPAPMRAVLVPTGLPPQVADLTPVDAAVQQRLGLPLGVLDLEGADPAAVGVRTPRRYPLGEVDGVGLAVTDAVVLPDGRVLVSAAAEDIPTAASVRLELAVTFPGAGRPAPGQCL